MPRTLIRTTQDGTVAPELQDRMIAEAAKRVRPDNPFDVRSVPSSHSPFASMPDRLAALLAEL